MLRLGLTWYDDRDGDGILEFAQSFRSSRGERDGLFWRVAEGERMMHVLNAPSPAATGAVTLLGAAFPEAEIIDACGPNVEAGSIESRVRAFRPRRPDAAPAPAPWLLRRNAALLEWPGAVPSNHGGSGLRARPS